MAGAARTADSGRPHPPGHRLHPLTATGLGHDADGIGWNVGRSTHCRIAGSGNDQRRPCPHQSHPEVESYRKLPRVRSAWEVCHQSRTLRTHFVESYRARIDHSHRIRQNAVPPWASTFGRAFALGRCGLISANLELEYLQDSEDLE